MKTIYKYDKESYYKIKKTTINKESMGYFFHRLFYFYKRDS